MSNGIFNYNPNDIIKIKQPVYLDTTVLVDYILMSNHFI